MLRSSGGSSRSRNAWLVLSLVLAAEVVGGLALLIPVISSFAGESEDPFGPKISLLLIVFIALAWVVVTFIGAWRKQASWARGSALTMHVLMFAAGTGVLQLGGLVGSPTLGWVLIVLAFVGFFAAVVARPANDPLEHEGESAEGDHASS